ncbi:MAG: PAS domain-containing protein [Bacteroidia bacterium]|nr:PAS domain-containing protein [Bacteroidia bacterium]
MQTLEAKRLAVLSQFNILDTAPEREFTQIVELASAILEMPISAISIIDEDRIWFKAQKGIGVKQVPLAISVCKFALDNPTLVKVVHDTWEDASFSKHPMVTNNPYMRFYAGVPLQTPDGFTLGTLCAMDSKPRSFGKEQERVLKLLASMVMKQMVMRKERIDAEAKAIEIDKLHEKTLRRLLEAQLIAKIGSWEWDLKNDTFYWSDEMFRLFGIEKKEITFEMWQNQTHPDDIGAVRKMLTDAIKQGKEGSIEYRVIRPNGQIIWVLGQGTVQRNLEGQVIFIKGTTQDISDIKLAETQKQHYTKALEEMLFAMSHKIRRPVASILGLINTMRMDKLNENNLMEYANYFQVSAHELDAYISQLTYFLEEKKLHLHQRPGST